MSLIILIAGTVGAIALSAVLLLLVRRRMSDDTLIIDPDGRLDLHYGLIATAFAVLLAFVVFAAFESYRSARAGAASEAVAVAELFRTGEFLPGADRSAYEGEIVCLGRSAVTEWPAMSDGSTNPDVEMWVDRLRQTLVSIEPRRVAGSAAFAHLLSEEDQRASGRRERLAEANPAITTPVWYALVIGGLAVVLTPLLFTRRRESFLVQAGLTSAVSVMVVSGLMLVWFLDHPYEGSSGSIEPTAMQQSLQVMQAQSPGLALPCDEAGAPLPS